MILTKNYLVRGLACLCFFSLFNYNSNAQQTSIGNDFWLVFNETVEEDFDFTPPQLIDLQIFISSQTGASGTVEIESLGFNEDFSVSPGELITVFIPDEALVIGTNVIDDLGIHVTSDNPISVYGLNQRNFSTDAYLAIPTAAWENEYLVMSYSGTFPDGSQFGIVAKEDNTTITITPTASYGGNIAGVPFVITLDEGETYQGRSGAGVDLTGTTIEASSPVGVFGGHFCANVPIGVAFCDHLTEMIPPSNSWGQSFVTVPFAERENGDIFRILASEDNTDINVNGASQGLLDRGEFIEINLSVASSIQSTAPVLVAQFMQGNEIDSDEFVGDPAMMIIPPREQFLGSYTVSTPATGFVTNHLNIVVDNNGVGSIQLDGVNIPSEDFSPIPGTNFNSAQIPVDLGTYTLTSSTAFGVFVYGTNDDDSYAYPGGQVYSAVAEVNSLALSPAFSEGPAFTQQCFQAELTDADGEPLEGIRIDFIVAGANEASGFSFTDENGIAEFCYTGENEGEDILTAFQGDLTQEVNVTWTAAVLDCEGTPNGAALPGTSCNVAGAVGVWSEDCECVPVDQGDCLSFRYFLANNPTGSGDSKLFEITLSDDDETAELEELLALSYSFHIAYSESENMVYIVRSTNGNFRKLDVSVENGTLSEEIVLSETLGGAVAAGFSPDGVFYIGSENNEAIYSVDTETGMVSFFRDAPVHGGDLAYREDGNLYLATRDFNGRVFELNTEGEVSAVQNVPPLVTGLAITDEGNGLVSVRDRNKLFLGDDMGNQLGIYNLFLDGESFTTGNGDMASGCAERLQAGECENFLTFYTGYPSNNADNELYGITLGEDNSLELNLIEGFSTDDNHIAVSPDGLIYSVRGSNLDIFDAESGSYVLQGIPIETASGQSLSGFPAATFDFNGILYLAKSSNSTVYSIEIEDGIAIANVAFSGVDIAGGDLVATGNADEQILWYINRNSGTLTNLLDNSFVELGFDEINGAALLSDGRLCIANGASGEDGGLFAIDLGDFSSVQLSSTGGPDIFFNGDLASGCPSVESVELPIIPAQSQEFVHSLKLQPNPTEGQTMVVFTIAENERLAVEVLDLNGRVIEVLYNGQSEHAGSRRVEFDGSYLNNGLYLVRMTSASFTEIQKLMIAK
jgi:hypothetical protein